MCSEPYDLQCIFALVGLLVAAGWAAWVALVVVNVVLGVVLLLDAGLAAPCQDLALTRTGDRRVRLGEVAHVRLAVTNTGRRRWHGWSRAGFCPSVSLAAWPPRARS